MLLAILVLRWAMKPENVRRWFERRVRWGWLKEEDYREWNLAAGCYAIVAIWVIALGYVISLGKILSGSW